MTSPPRRDVWHVFLFAVACRAVTCLLLVLLPRFVPAFDASAESLLSRGSLLEGFVRWDVLHFVRIAEHGGYRLEKDFAFMPGAPLLLRAPDQIARWVESAAQLLRTESNILSGVLRANEAGIAAAVVLHRLTFAYTRSAAFSKTTALLYSIPPAAYVLSVPLTEPFFALLAFLGMLYAHDGRMLLASILFACTTLLRSNGLLNGGFIVWHLLLQPWHRLTVTRRVLRSAYAAALCFVMASPFLAVQAYAYTRFCDGVLSRPWCYHRLPMIYPFVQSHYWDVGLFRYWTLQQLPLFLISAPVLAMSFAASTAYYEARGKNAIFASLPFLGRVKSTSATTPFYEPALLPAMHLHTFMALVLLFASHVQICLRQASTSPVLFWFAAHLMSQGSPWGRRWVLYCLVWGTVSIVLWAAFLPPA